EKGEDREGGQAAGRPAHVVEGRRPRIAVWPDPDCREDGKETAAPGPEGEPAAVAPEGRRNADAAPAAAREEVDGCREERQQGADEHELDRPAAHDPAADEDVAGGPRAERDPLLHRIQGVLGRSADLQEPPAVEAPRVVAEPAARPVGRGRDRQRRDAAGDERGVLVAAVREAEVDQLANRAVVTRLGADLGWEACPAGPDEAWGRGAGRVAADLQLGAARSCDRRELERRYHGLGLARVPR